YTINGFAPTDFGYRELAKLLADGLYGPAARAARADESLVNAAVKMKDYFWNTDYAIINGVHTHGQRYNPFGPQNYPAEVAKSRQLAAVRDTLIHDIAQGKRRDLTVDDRGTAALPPVPSNFKPDMKNGNPTEFLSGEAALAKMKVAPGYKVELFASEEKFPDLKKPVQMSFDNRGRLWVATTPTYPHYRPGDPLPNDKLIILEDTDGDGKADKQSVFADHLHLPIGFELAPEGVYVSQEPNLALLIDEDQDGKADRTELILHGFDSHDSHHAISAYCADASGAFYLLEGRFLHSQVETPYGPRRCNDGGAWRFDPKSYRLERLQVDVSNPWGFSFDTWEQPFLSDASPGENWWALPFAAKMPYGIEQVKVEQFVPKRSRPSSGAEFVSSRHFPDANQGDFMTCNTIGFLGISFGKKQDDGAGFVGRANGDLLSSADGNFRPVDLEFAPDGSLYFLDWHNPLIGHMQHNARDPNRDHEHGRIYRVTYPGRPLVKPAKVAGATVAELLANLKEPEYRTRYRTRRELRAHPAAEVLPAIKAWVAQLDPQDPAYEHHLCEALWATLAQNQPDGELIRRLLKARQFEARAAAADVVRHAYRQLPDHVALLNQAVRDEHPRVRLTAVVAATWLDNADGARIALEAFRKPVDRWLAPVLRYALTYTLKDDVAALQAAGALDLADNPAAAEYLAGKSKLGQPIAETGPKPVRKLTAAEEKVFQLGREVYFRDAHCATCHQADGKGIANVYPPLARSDWLADDERAIKIVLKGLWGPITVSGQSFDPAKGVPPMMGFGGMLNDQEAAAVLSFVRLSFGNSGKVITPAQVAKVRAATKDRVNFYTAEEILKEHPLQAPAPAKK
ncbi:MAG: PVC-type heme-binding CxxCH protein, partial [Opitutia bacterium]